jgi:hypothetical protein
LVTSDNDMVERTVKFNPGLSRHGKNLNDEMV